MYRSVYLTYIHTMPCHAMPFHYIPTYVQTHTHRDIHIYIPYRTVPYRTVPYMYCIQTTHHLYIYIYSFFNTYETFPVEITSAHAREHLTHACATCASKERRARARRASKDRRARARCASTAHEHCRRVGQHARACARVLWTRARANKLT